MKALLPILLFSLVSLLYGAPTSQPDSATNEQPSQVTYVKPFMFVLYQTNSAPEVVRLAKQMSSDYGLREPTSVVGNPGCCLWLEVKPSHLKAGSSYYSATVLKSGETWLYASSPELLEKAAERLKKNAHSQSGQLMVSVGAFSYYDK